MRIALVDSGLGTLATAAALRRMRPDLDLVLSTDPDHAPWGPRPPEEVAALALECARAALRYGPAALVLACNTASVHCLTSLRAHLEPRVPVVGTVPAIKPAAATGGPIAIWATPATTRSAYQRALIREFAAAIPVAEVASATLASAVDAGEEAAIAAAIEEAAARTPREIRALVLGCTQYRLVADRIQAALAPGVELFDAAEAVAAQTLRRLGLPPRPEATPTGTLVVLASGRPGGLPPAALGYEAGRVLARPGGRGTSPAGATADRRDRPGPPSPLAAG
ncbi:MAG TPA: aspartate/glutamate racemase family protein [Candidatus Dormibacteraeota bacterium]|nr:aspartate/glutamate racemase family protein [Candidatus Dormibacteraeota bacterium]